MASLNSPSSFNELHSSFVTTEDGTTLKELLLVLGSISLTPMLVPFLLPWIVPPSFVQQAVLSNDFFLLIRAILEYPFQIVLPIWIVTIFAGESGDGNSSLLVIVTLACVLLGVLIVNHSVTAPKWLGFRRHWMKIKDLPTGWTRKESAAGESSMTDKQPRTGNHQTPKLPFINNYRAIVIYVTVLCILAVDFPIFPRRFSKTKTYGISLMDVGTGCFIFANGIVAPEARNKMSPFSKNAKSVIPLIILGFVRLISVKGIEYQEVVEEYGVHWNFFFTLVGVKLLSSLLFIVFDASKGLKIAAVLGILYEVLLNSFDFQNQYILNPEVPRIGNLVNANREGIFSVVGYVVIYMASVYFGRLVYWKKRSSVAHWTDYGFRSFLQISLIWMCYALSTGFGNPPCRRTANLSYALLMIALNYSLLWFQMALALVLVSLQHLGLIHGPMVFYELNALHHKGEGHPCTLQRMTRRYLDSKRKQERKDTADAKEKALEEKMEKLEDQLEETVERLKKEQGDGGINEETFRKIGEIEEEIQGLEQQLQESDSEGEILEKTIKDKRNFVLLPDLSKGPVILESICYNGLFIFLLGNLLTGLINCSIYTMYTPLYMSLCYLWLYVTLIAASSVSLFWYKIQLKFW